MLHLIPVATLAERADLNRLSNVIDTVDGNHTAGAGAIADGIADSGYFHTLAERISREVQEATAGQIAADLRKAGQDNLANQVMAQYTDLALA
jgi:hypothetical protein